jgi:hypothetical protein
VAESDQDEREVMIPDLSRYAFVVREPDPYSATTQRFVDITCRLEHPEPWMRLVRSIPDIFRPDHDYSLPEVLEMIQNHHDSFHA